VLAQDGVVGHGHGGNNKGRVDVDLDGVVAQQGPVQRADIEILDGLGYEERQAHEAQGGLDNEGGVLQAPVTHQQLLSVSARRGDGTVWWLDGHGQGGVERERE
jgi:hypothetical protein